MNKGIQIMGIVNCTPDSFYDGGKYGGVDGLVCRALQMEEEGADWIDVGGESTRPGANPVAIEEEIRRIVPVISEIRKRSRIPLSVDTTKSLVATAALDAGAGMINDVSGLLSDPEMVPLAAHKGVPVVIMHSRGNPQTMQGLTDYQDVVAEVFSELRERVDGAIKAGIKKDQIRIDPGFGFAKNFEQNVLLLKNLSRFKKMGTPLVVGLSRKSFIGQMLGKPKTEDRLIGSLACALFAALHGADMLRVHDVKETRDVLEVLTCLSA